MVAKKVKSLVITTEDRAGMLSELTSEVAGKGVNISAICAYAENGKATFLVITADNQKVKESIASRGWDITEEDVVMVDLPDKVGAGKEMADKLKEKDISLTYCYGTTCGCGENNTCRLVLKSSNPDEIVAALS